MIPTDLKVELRQRVAKVELKEPYSDFDSLYNVMVTMSNLFDEPEEHSRLNKLLSVLKKADLDSILSMPEIAQLVNLKPPLETVIAWDRNEKSKAEEIRNSLRRLRSSDGQSQDVLIAAIVNILSTIRNKRYHGFKSPQRPRDEEILGSGAVIIKKIMEKLLTTIELA